MAAGPLTTKEYDRIIAASYEKNPVHGRLSQCDITLSSESNYHTYISSKSQKLFLSVPLDGRIFQVDENFNSNPNDSKPWNDESVDGASATHNSITIEDSMVPLAQDSSMMKSSEHDNHSVTLLQEELNITKMKLEEVTKENENLLNEIEILKESKEKLFIDNQSLEDKNKELELQLKEQKKLYNTIVSEVEELKFQNDDLKAHILELKNQIDLQESQYIINDIKLTEEKMILKMKLMKLKFVLNSREILLQEYEDRKDFSVNAKVDRVVVESYNREIARLEKLLIESQHAREAQAARDRELIDSIQIRSDATHVSLMTEMNRMQEKMKISENELTKLLEEEKALHLSEIEQLQADNDKKLKSVSHL